MRRLGDTLVFSEVLLMSGSPVVSLRRLQSVVHRVTGRHVSSLDLASALLGAMDSGSFRFERCSLKAYRDRLRNWQMADSLIIATWDAERPKQALAFRSARLDLPTIYETYRKRAEAEGLAPFAFVTFRIRAYELTSVSVAEARKKELANASV